MKKSIIAAMASGLLSCAFAASAMSGDATAPGVAVVYGDLDLQSGAGQQALKGRLKQAARSVCPDSSSRDLGTRLAGKRCVRQAVGRAKAEVTEQQVARAAKGQASPG